MILFLFIILLCFIIVNFYLKKNEAYTGFKTTLFFDELKNKNYDVDENKMITSCKNNNCQQANYAYHFNDPNAVRLVKDKIATSTILKKNNIPVPKFKKINMNDSQPNIMETFQYPIIIKPVNGTFGQDVHVNIENNKELGEILQKVKKSKYKNFMMEDYIEGNVYRIFVFRNKIIDVVKREKPFVIGNGTCSLRILIEEKNDQLKKEGLFPTTNLSAKYLFLQGVNMDTIIPKGKRIIISQVINLHNGAPIEQIDMKNIPYINNKLFINVGKVLGINCYGLDYISKDITQPFNQGKNMILEVNGTPDTEIHTNVDTSFFKKIVDNIF